MERRLVPVIVAVTSLVAIAGWSPSSLAKSPSSEAHGQAGEQVNAAGEGQSAKGNREQPMVLGTDYVVGRYLLPLVIGIAAVFALVLFAIVHDERPSEESSTTPAG